MEEQKINITVTPTEDGKPVEIILREGQAVQPLPLRERNSLKVIGLIATPADYMLDRKPYKDEAVIFVNIQKATIVCLSSQINPLADRVTGTLQVAKEMGIFDINGPTKYSIVQLRDLAKINQRFFSDKQEFTNLLVSLSNFKADVQTVIEKKNDNRGNVLSAFEQKLSAGFAEKITLEMPIYTGEPAVRFQVEICMDLIGQELKLWLISPDLSALIETEKTRIFDAQIERLKESGYLILNVTE